MYTVEEIKNKVKTGTWTKRGCGTLCGGAEADIGFIVYTEEIYYMLWDFLPIIFGNMLIL